MKNKQITISRKMTTILHKILVFLRLRKAGYYRLTFRGLPVILRDDFPKNKVGFLNERTGIMQVLDIKTEKIIKIKMPKGIKIYREK